MAVAKTKPDSSSQLAGLIALVIILPIIWLLLPYRLKLSIEYGVSEESVFVDPKPRDCEWERAPLGDKGCHYEKIVSAVKGNGGAVANVYVTWQKVPD